MQGPIIGIGPFNTFTLVQLLTMEFAGALESGDARATPFVDQRERSSEVCGCHQGGKGVRIGIWALYSCVVLSLIA
eukprot:4825321-Prymnesium_polylepis.2